MEGAAFPQLHEARLKDLRLRAPRIVRTMRSNSEGDEFEDSEHLVLLWLSRRDDRETRPNAVYPSRSPHPGSVTGGPR